MPSVPVCARPYRTSQSPKEASAMLVMLMFASMTSVGLTPLIRHERPATFRGDNRNDAAGFALSKLPLTISCHLATSRARASASCTAMGVRLRWATLRPRGDMVSALSRVSRSGAAEYVMPCHPRPRLASSSSSSKRRLLAPARAMRSAACVARARHTTACCCACHADRRSRTLRSSDCKMGSIACSSTTEASPPPAPVAPARAVLHCCVILRDDSWRARSASLARGELAECPPPRSASSMPPLVPDDLRSSPCSAAALSIASARA
mmetsp:Transcript_9324/g.28902  ORF Transcript_9324/g.28902 Transcript_9324/m.28902 type:complete len:266 (-) Transcript_9324:380-1177(-)